jgi:hypothetical protein
MVNPVPSHPRITTAYGVAGNWSGGRHGGADFGSPGINGATVVAPWGGTVTGANWGSAYGNHVVIDFDRLPDGSPGLWGVLAHMSRVDKRSGRVEAGQRIGAVGSSGNATGPHLHFEVQRAAGWRSGNHVNPQSWIDAQKSAPPPPPAGADFGPVYIDKLHYGQKDSDSVRALQRALNAHRLAAPGNITLVVSGNYLDLTDQVVRACQAQHRYGSDAPRTSFVGRRQAEHLGLRIVG